MINSTNVTNEIEEGISLNEILNSIIKHFKLIILILIISILSALIYLNYTNEVYISSATILVDPIKKNSTIGKILSSDFFYSNNDISTEIQLLTNITNLEQAYNSLDLSKYTTPDGLIYKDSVSINSIKNNISVKTFKDTNIIEISVSDTNPKFTSDFANAIAISFNKLLSSYSKDSQNMQIEFLNNKIPETEQKIKEANNKLFNYKAETKIDFISNNIKTFVNHISYLQMREKPLKLQYLKNKALLNDFENEYDNLPKLETLKNNTIILEWLHKYEKAYNELILFDISSNINSWNTTNLSVVNSNLNLGLNERISQLNGEMNEAKKQIINEVTKLIDSQTLLINSKSNTLFSLNKFTYTVMETLTSEVALNNINSTIVEFQEEFNQLPVIEKELSILESDVDSLEKIRNELNSLLEQISLTSAAENNNVKLVSPAKLPTKPISPNKLLILAISILLGLSLSVLLCLVIELNDNVFHTIIELQNYLKNKKPLIGWIPYIINKKNINQKVLITDAKKTFLDEQFKILASNIIYKKNNESKIFSITSSNINEGKTYLICNIAITLAQKGYNILIIDGDIKFPNVANNFNIKTNKNGYIKTIQNNESLEKIVIKPIEGLNTLNIISPGESELFSSVFLKKTDPNILINKLKNDYDYIFIDLPPFEFASDILGLIKYVDSILITCRLSVTTKKNLETLFIQLDDYSDKIDGIIATACSKQSLEKATGKYNSYYHYSYSNIKSKQKNDLIFVKTEKKAKKLYKKSIKKRTM